jgi:hypothetical protein
MTEGDATQPQHAVEALLFYRHGGCAPSPPNRNRLLPISIRLKVPKSRLRDFGGGEGRGEGGVPKGQTRRCERTFRLTRTREAAETNWPAWTRGAPPSSQPSPPKGGEGARCDKWTFSLLLPALQDPQHAPFVEALS